MGHEAGETLERHVGQQLAGDQSRQVRAALRVDERLGRHVEAQLLCLDPGLGHLNSQADLRPLDKEYVAFAPAAARVDDLGDAR